MLSDRTSVISPNLTGHFLPSLFGICDDFDQSFLPFLLIYVFCGYLSILLDIFLRLLNIFGKIAVAEVHCMFVVMYILVCI